ncbi:Inner-membrane translocator [uncultured Alphaproteobacteria bacterium]|uniref:Inner-membrane translocator n=1 Tax=uncultured Alphaproteobacteria bacterium TaxID=91750 RepID=A0A212K711_9PROT|nr:Inner-membrane translocator [uncultured Alphaproteobacteria bacterium]
MLKLELRPQASRTMTFVAPMLAIAATVAAGGLLFAALGFAPLSALSTFFLSPLGDLYGITEWLLKATPLAIIACALALGFRGNVWNIGAEGQLIVGAIAAGGAALALYEVSGLWVLPLVLLAGVAGGALWAAIPALLRIRFHANEILTSLMLNYVATLLLAWLVHGPWRSPEGYNFPETRMFTDSALMPILFEGTRLHVGALFAPLVALVAWVVLSRSFLGFQIKVIGMTPAAGSYAGFGPNRVIAFTLMFGGGMAGLAGAMEVCGPIGQLVPTVSPGYGYTAIIAAFLGRLHPIGILLAALLLALTYMGGDAAQIALGVPLAVTQVFQGMILFFLLAADVLIRYRVRFSLANGARR